MNNYTERINLKEYPRPQFVREQWTNLNGKWDFAFDKDNSGLEKRYPFGFEKQFDIVVPFAYQTKTSGIGISESVPCIWYHKRIVLDFKPNERIMLHLEGSDYQTQIYLNGVFVGEDEGAYHRESFDLTPAAKQGENDLTIRVLDDYSKEKPRGKQRSKAEDYECWYIDASGLYKTVWLEKINEKNVQGIKITPYVFEKNVKVEYEFSSAAKDARVRTRVSYQGKEVVNDEFIASENHLERVMPLGEEVYLWEISDGKLYDIEIEFLENGVIVDKVYSYFGLREITWGNGEILLNGKPLYQKLALDQGYYTESDLTAKSIEDFSHDILTLQAMGFNGVRKHEKFEDERFFYLADTHGFIVWNEMPSFYEYTERSKAALKTEWPKNVKQVYNHPSIFALVLFNESWGIPKIKSDIETQAYVNEIYYLTKEIDKTRPVITNDGWEHTISDILTIHHYTQSGENLHNYFDTLEKCTAKVYADHHAGAFAEGYSYNRQPIIISEFGGTSFVKDTHDGAWGYGNAVSGDKEFLERFSSLIHAIKSIPFICGYCYTQVTDVYREVNGLMDQQHNAKFDKKTIAKILE